MESYRVDKDSLKKLVVKLKFLASADAITLLRIINEKGSIQAQEIHKMTRDPLSTVREHLEKMVDWDLLKKSGGKTESYYSLNTDNIGRLNEYLVDSPLEKRNQYKLGLKTNNV